ncbi:MAG: dihydrolipoamide acetyltransferase family protein [Amphiplicatus sp.]
MGEYVIKLPDVGEGVAEAELVEWLVEEGATVREDETLASVMTDKATVEIPSPVAGKVIWRGPKIGEAVAVGAPIIRIEIDGEGEADGPEKPDAAPSEERPRAAPAVRRRAMEAGVDLHDVKGTGPSGRITREDIVAHVEHAPAAPRMDNAVKEIPLIGLRRKIAEKMTRAATRIPHITYVESVDMTALEALRAALNEQRKEGRPKLTPLAFLMRALARAVADQPRFNAHYDDEAGVLRQYGAVHVGVATQTDDGLLVPIVRHVEAMGLWRCAGELARLADGARAGMLKREDLIGSTITISSLGALGGVMSTPVINHPEVAIIGVNKIEILPKWEDGQFIPRRMMNLSSSFDHRIIDGYDAAVFVRRIKTLLETPAAIFIED